MMLVRSVLIWFCLAATLSGQDTYDPAVVQSLCTESLAKGNPARGAVLYAAPTSIACPVTRLVNRVARLGLIFLNLVRNKKSNTSSSRSCGPSVS